jgi:hypothetical protein
MRYWMLLVLPVALLLTAAERAPRGTVRFHVETPGAAAKSFSTPVTLKYGKRTTRISRLAALSEAHIVKVRTFDAEDGSKGAYFLLSDIGRYSLETLSTQSRGLALVAFVNGRQVVDLVIDRKISDGILVIPLGLTPDEAARLEKMFPEKSEKDKAK